VLDWMLPERSGIEVCRRLRSRAETKEFPIIMLTARGEEGDRVLGLDAGADDYVVKPYSPREMVARVQAVLRRSQVLGIEDDFHNDAQRRFTDAGILRTYRQAYEESTDAAAQPAAQRAADDRPRGVENFGATIVEATPNTEDRPNQRVFLSTVAAEFQEGIRHEETRKPGLVRQLLARTAVHGI